MQERGAALLRPGRAMPLWALEGPGCSAVPSSMVLPQQRDETAMPSMVFQEQREMVMASAPGIPEVVHVVQEPLPGAPEQD